MAKDIAISVEHVSMLFNLATEKVDSAKEYIIKLLRKQLHYEPFWALADVSFEVARGEIMGVMGFNGAGKSTLLKIIAGVYKPTSGKVTIHGSIAPLLELGAGFDYEITAKENIYLYGAVLGHSPAYMDKHYKDIMNFAELWEFENVPLKNFSSGMSARLGFAVATMVQPDVLIADEVLGVGDYRFQAKCAERINSMVNNGTTVLLVSHSAQTIREMCSRAILLEKGHVIAEGKAEEVFAHYQAT